MSELKVIDVDKMADVRSLSGQFYRKSEADKVIARHKRKRCLAMAKWCYDRWIRTYHMSKLQKTKFYSRWQKRWEGLADEPTWERFLQLIHKEYKYK